MRTYIHACMHTYIHTISIYGDVYHITCGLSMCAQSLKASSLSVYGPSLALAQRPARRAAWPSPICLKSWAFMRSTTWAASGLLSKALTGYIHNLSAYYIYHRNVCVCMYVCMYVYVYVYVYVCVYVCSYACMRISIYTTCILSPAACLN